MSGWLEWVEPCEHGHQSEHWMTPDGNPPEGFTFSYGPPGGMCPGGSRRRVDLDYEAAISAFRHASILTAKEGRYHLTELVPIAVDAALGLAEEECHHCGGTGKIDGYLCPNESHFSENRKSGRRNTWDS